MAHAISVRLDDDALKALRALEASGMTRSEAIRTALVSASKRLRQRRDLAAEVAALEADDTDRAEMRRSRRSDGVPTCGGVTCFASSRGARARARAARRAFRGRASGRCIPPALGRHRGADIDECQAGVVPPEIEIMNDSTRVLVEQLGAVDVERLGRAIGHLTREELWSVDEAVLTVLGLD